MTSMIKGTGRNLAVIIGLFALSLAAFVVCTTLFSLGVGLLVLVVGLFILVACLIVAGWSSRMTIALLGYAGITLPATRLSGGWTGLRWETAAADLPAILAGSAPRPGQLHPQHHHLFACADLGLRWPRWRHLLVLEPLAAGADRGPACPARLSRPVCRTHVQ